jgi:hypothetical protein
VGHCGLGFCDAGDAQRRLDLARSSLAGRISLALTLRLRLDETGLGIGKMRSLGIATLAVAVSGCALQRAQIAQDARVQMVGMSREQVLICMGPPANKAAEGQMEVWSYDSGDGTVVASGSVSYGNFSGVSSRRFCQISVVMTGASVASVN